MNSGSRTLLRRLVRGLASIGAIVVALLVFHLILAGLAIGIAASFGMFVAITILVGMVLVIGGSVAIIVPAFRTLFDDDSAERSSRTDRTDRTDRNDHNDHTTRKSHTEPSHPTPADTQRHDT